MLLSLIIFFRKGGFIMQCLNHIDREAVAMCISCQKFYCADCRTVIDGKNYCFPCAEKIQAASAPAVQPSEAPSEPVQAPVAKPTPAAPVMPTATPTIPVKKKSGCLKWAIITLAIAFFLALVLAVVGYFVAKKYIIPKIKQQIEQPFAQSGSESTPSEDTSAESVVETAPGAEDTTIQAESEPAQETGMSTETPPSIGSETIAPSPPAPSEPSAPPPPGIIRPPKPVPAIQSDKLVPYLPNPLSNWRIGNTKNGNFEQENYTYSRAEREYTNPRENSKITITISDFGRNPRMYRKFHRPTVYSNAEGYLRLVRIYGYPAIEKMEYTSKTAELSIEVALRYVVEIKGENISDSTILTGYANQMDLTNLAQLR
jgi:hypothetical protein